MYTVVNCGNFYGKHDFYCMEKSNTKKLRNPFRSHNKLAQFINDSHDISIILKKKGIKQSKKMLNGKYEL